MSQQINLFDPSFRRQEKPFSARTMAWSLAAVVLGCLALYGYTAHQARALQVALKDIDARLAAQRQQAGRLSSELAAASGGKLIVDEIARAEARLAARRELLKSITAGVSANAEGYAGLMTALARRATQGLWLTGFTVSESSAVAIKGRVLDASLVPAYIRALHAEDALRGRNVTELKVSAKVEQEPASKPAAGGAPAPAAGPSRYLEFRVALTPREVDP